jgi:hypothetical protein
MSQAAPEADCVATDARKALLASFTAVVDMLVRDRQRVILRVRLPPSAT